MIKGIYEKRTVNINLIRKTGCSPLKIKNKTKMSVFLLLLNLIMTVVANALKQGNEIKGI